MSVTSQSHSCTSKDKEDRGLHESDHAAPESTAWAAREFLAAARTFLGLRPSVSWPHIETCICIIIIDAGTCLRITPNHFRNEACIFVIFLQRTETRIALAPPVSTHPLSCSWPVHLAETIGKLCIASQESLQARPSLDFCFRCAEMGVSLPSLFVKAGHNLLQQHTTGSTRLNLQLFPLAPLLL